MAEEMEVDMSFSDVTNVDISMADADISRLLNGTQVLVAGPVGDVIANPVVTPRHNATNDYEDANHTFKNDETETQHIEDVMNQTVQVNNEFNSTFDVADNRGDGNGNGRVSTRLNSTFDANNERPHARMADISSIGNISIIASAGGNSSGLSDASKTIDCSSSEVTVLENQERTLQADKTAGKCTNRADGKICNLLAITTNVELDAADQGPPSISEATSEKSEEDVYEDALPLQEEIAQISDGTLVVQGHDAGTCPKLDDVRDPRLPVPENTAIEVEREENVAENDVPVDLRKHGQAGNIEQFFSSLTQKKRNSSLPPVRTNEDVSEKLCRSLPVNSAGEYYEERVTVGLDNAEDVPTVSSTNMAEREDGFKNATNVEPTITDCTTLNKRLEVADKTMNGTGDDCDSSHLLMLNHSLTPLENQDATSSQERQAPKSGLLDCTLDSAIVASLSLGLQQEKVLQAANRKSPADTMPHAKESQASSLDKTLANGVENKENINHSVAGEPGRRSVAREKPRPSLLLQFDPLPNLNASVVNGESAKVAASPATAAVKPASSPAKHVGRLIDVDFEHDLEHKRAMDAVNEEKMNLIQEVNRLKLELNQVKQENTTLTLEIQKKEEVYLKAEANNQMRESQLSTDNKQLLEKLESMKEHNDNEELVQAKKQTKEAAEANKRLVEENVHYKRIMNEYEATLSANNCEKEKLKAEHATVTQHLAALEVSFSDTITKYDRCKEIIAGFSRNEETLQERLGKSNQIATKYEERYETLKSHANAQLDKANKDLLAAKDAHRAELAKLNTIVKRLEIKNASLRQTLEQKTAECAALASLCDEMTGSAMH